LVFFVFLLLIFDLLCKRFSSPPCIGSAVVALFIKRGESLFQEITCPKLELWRSAHVSRLNALGFLHFLVLKDFKKGLTLVEKGATV
jgi:hypothetical protein